MFSMVAQNPKEQEDGNCRKNAERDAKQIPR
jgi:hypothetical protein